MDVGAHLDAVRRDSPALVDAALAADPDRRLATCPEWTPIDLVWHVAEVHDFQAALAAGGDLDHYRSPARPNGDEAVVDAARDMATRLLGVLADTDPATPVRWWLGERDVAFVARRCAHETAMHRWDAERAAGREHRIDDALAADGVDEYLLEFLPFVMQTGGPTLGGSLHLHCTDVEGEWIVEPDGDGVAVRREHAKGDCAMRGPASDLDLVTWRRLPLEAVEVIGDRQVAERFVAPRSI